MGDEINMITKTESKQRKVNSLQVIVAALNQNQDELINRLNLQTDAIISNQCDSYGRYVIGNNGCNIEWINTAERGVGLNRNNAWFRSTADVILVSDDDMTFRDGYKEIVLKLFNSNPKADVIVFNIGEKNPTRAITAKPHYTKKCGYGAARFAIRREAVQMKSISFNLFFGGGSTYSHGEDTLFLSECKAKGLHILVVPQVIADLDDSRASTWNNGYTEKRIYDDGVLWAAQGLNLLTLRKIKYAYNISRSNSMSFKTVFNLLSQGINHYHSV